ncbi:unnamed protein product [Allacma fusca]|uniref:Uncharacterized protein n=1 Tax=Allacma fusca TaxID=39272 RepID=A0A8J2PFR9_9HEXA|nr:unnamed protein product [Allacma fusca]
MEARKERCEWAGIARFCFNLQKQSRRAHEANSSVTSDDPRRFEFSNKKKYFQPVCWKLTGRTSARFDSRLSLLLLAVLLQITL